MKFSYDRKKIIEEETQKFKVIGGNVDEALVQINTIFQKKYKRDFSFDTDSIHSFLWAVLATSNRSIRRILEIGTSEGEGTYVLAQLFPNTEIVTVDLPESDPLLRAFYKRETDEQYADYIAKQEKNTQNSHIRTVKKNSFFLPSVEEGTFDLVWVDGGHLYPEVAWDICNVWNMTNPGGIIMCDDIIPTKKMYKTAYASSESFEVLSYLVDRTSMKLELFLKRRASHLYPFAVTRKYIAYFEKPLL